MKEKIEEQETKTKELIDKNTDIDLDYKEEYYKLQKENYKLKQQIKELQKENEEIRIKNNAIKRESEAYAEYMIRLDIEKQDYFEKYRYYLQQNESLTKEFSNVIPVQKVKDKIEDLKMSGGSDGKDNTENVARELAIEVLQDILDESKEK